MTSLATSTFDCVATLASSAIFVLALGLVETVVAQALERPYRLRRPAARVRPGAATPRAPLPHFVKRPLPGVA